MEQSELEQLVTGAVVVGLDESPFAGDVAGFGLDEAARRGVPAVMLTAYTDPARWGVPGAIPVTAAEVEHDVLAHARATVDAALATRGEPGPVHVVAAEGPPVEVLVAASRHAAVLVVGHRGRGDLSSRLIGSVGLSCVIHAHCTLTVVRPTPTP